jgi:hypothetical protein
MIIAVMFPFTLVVIFTSSLVYNTPSLQEQLLHDIQDYTLCLIDAQNSVSKSCTSTAVMDSLAFTRIAGMILYGMLGVIILIYYFTPTPARQFWMSNIRQLWNLISRMKRKGSGDAQCSA